MSISDSNFEVEALSRYIRGVKDCERILMNKDEEELGKKSFEKKNSGREQLVCFQ